MKRNTESTTSMTMTREVSCHESTVCLAFVPVTGTLTSTHRDCLIVACFSQEPDIQHHVSQGQTFSADLP